MKEKKHQFQRGVCVLLAVMLLLGVTACTPADKGPSQSTQSTTTTAVTTTTTAETTTTATTTTAETKATTTTTTKKTTTTPPTTTTTKPVVDDTSTYKWNDDGVLKILTVGNSFSEDMMYHAYSIAKDIGIEKIELGNLYYGSCRLEQHYDFWINNQSVYSYQTNKTGTWKTVQTSFETAFQTTDWDYISFQESAQQVQSSPVLYKHLDELVAMAKERCPNAKIVWHMPWANSHANYNKNIMYMYNDLCKAVREQIHTRKAFEMVIPCGTSIQNVRTSSNGNQNLLRDGWHLSDTGRYIAALTLVKQLTGKNIDGVKWTPNETTAQLLPTIVEAVNNAVADPLAVTQSSY